MRECGCWNFGRKSLWLCGLRGRREVFSFLCPAVLQRVTAAGSALGCSLNFHLHSCAPLALLLSLGCFLRTDKWLCPPEKPVPPSSCDKEDRKAPSPPCHCKCHSQPKSNEAATSGTPSAPCSAHYPDTGASRTPGSPLTNTGNFISRQLKFCSFQGRAGFLPS